jgi:hypothetical protein
MGMEIHYEYVAQTISQRKFHAQQDLFNFTNPVGVSSTVTRPSATVWSTMRGHPSAIGAGAAELSRDWRGDGTVRSASATPPAAPQNKRANASALDVDTAEWDRRPPVNGPTTTVGTGDTPAVAQRSRQLRSSSSAGSSSSDEVTTELTDARRTLSSGSVGPREAAADAVEFAAARQRKNRVFRIGRMAWSVTKVLAIGIAIVAIYFFWVRRAVALVACGAL